MASGVQAEQSSWVCTSSRPIVEPLHCRDGDPTFTKKRAPRLARASVDRRVVGRRIRGITRDKLVSWDSDPAPAVAFHCHSSQPVVQLLGVAPSVPCGPHRRRPRESIVGVLDHLLKADVADAQSLPEARPVAPSQKAAQQVLGAVRPLPRGRASQSRRRESDRRARGARRPGCRSTSRLVSTPDRRPINPSSIKDRDQVFRHARCLIRNRVMRFVAVAVLQRLDVDHTPARRERCYVASVEHQRRPFTIDGVVGPEAARGRLYGPGPIEPNGHLPRARDRLSQVHLFPLVPSMRQPSLSAGPRRGLSALPSPDG